MSLDPSKIARQILIDDSIVTLRSSDEDWPCFTTRVPNRDNVPNDTLAIINTTGIKQGRLMGSTTLMKRGFQVLLYSSEYDDGWDKMTEIQESYDTINRTTVTFDSVDYLVQVVVRFSDIIPVGQEEDGKRREIFSQNFLMEVQTA